MKRNLRYLAVLAALTVLFYISITFLNAYNPKEAQETLPKYHIQVILKARANPPDFWRIVEQGLEVAGKEFNIDYEINGPTHESDIQTQMQMMRAAIDKNPDAIILAAGDYELLVPLCAEAVKKGIRVIMLDSDVNYDQTGCFVGTNNYELGGKLGLLVDENLNAGDRFGVIGHVENSATAMERSRGLLDTLSERPYHLAGLMYCNGSTELAKQQTIDMLQNNPDIKCIVGLNESSALGIASAVFESGLAGQVQVIACDSSEEQIKFMENGTIQACVIQRPFNMGYLSMQAAVQILEGKKIEKNIDTGSVTILREEMNRPENQKLLFPFSD